MTAQVSSSIEKPESVRVRTSQNILVPFSKEKIVRSLVEETSIDESIAKSISQEVEHDVSRMHLKYLTAPLIREIVNVKLLEHGYESARMRYTRLGMPVYDVRELIFTGPSETEKIPHNPETVHKMMADLVSREYTYVNILPPTRVDDHMSGNLHIHRLNYFATRPYCLSHDLRPFLRNGLKVDGLGLFAPVAGPAKASDVAFLQASRVLSAAQINCSGSQGLIAFNVLLAPYVKGLDYTKIKQLVQMFVFEMSHMYVTRGGQTMTSTIDLHFEIPKNLASSDAVSSGGSTKGVYSDYSEESKSIAMAVLDIYIQGDYAGKPFDYPQLNLFLGDSPSEDLLSKALELAEKFQTPHFVLGNQEGLTYQNSSYVFNYPKSEVSRGGVLQTVTLNLPKIAYDSGSDEARIFTILDQRMAAAKDILFLKREVVHRSMEGNLLPFLQQKILDDESYLIPDIQPLSLGITGMNEFVELVTGSQLSEKTAQDFGRKVLGRMKENAEEYRAQSGLDFQIAGCPATQILERFFKVDSINYNAASKIGAYTPSFWASSELDASNKLLSESSLLPFLEGGALQSLPVPESGGLQNLLDKAQKSGSKYIKFEGRKK
ncbi:MAG: anaerobic ribonucleoside-triphosphate reductase [archaeon]|nr:anaerobic ribonucleoside triphosphate reductase [Euryarchaeota archaeon]MDP6704323.1 anaerobic ribonucleoside-triphosphate reductase [archaeon]MDP7260497.1 anaerobic ribonucleoside-triphosphate reductase [archaeon]